MFSSYNNYKNEELGFMILLTLRTMALSISIGLIMGMIIVTGTKYLRFLVD